MPESSGAQEIRVSANADSDTVQEPISKVPVPENIPADKTAELEEFSGVVTTPTKNRFDALETEKELQDAFRNLHQPESSMALSLVTIPEAGEDEVLSDGSGTMSKSTLGVSMSRSANNSDEELEGVHTIRIQAKHGFRSAKARKIPQ